MTTDHARKYPVQLLRTGLCALLVSLPIIAWSQSSSTLEGVELEIKNTENQLKKLEAELAESRRLRQRLEQTLTAENKKVSEREKRISELNRDIAQYNDQLDRLQAEIKLQQSHVEERKRVLGNSIRKAQRIASGSGLKVTLQSDNPAEADRINVYTDYFMQAQRRAIDEQQASIARISAAHQEALKNRNWLNHIKKKATRQFNSYKQQSDEKQRDLSNVESRITQTTQTVAELKASQVRLQQLMEELRAAQVAKSGYFLSGQGGYSLPVNGEIKARFGEIKSVGKLRWNGYFIGARAGLPVRAIADGSVVYSDWLQGFGMLVILDHGDGYMTLYGGNREVMVKNEDWVETGATIATVGDSGGQKTSGVYFEIRHNAKPVDPKQWVNPENSITSAKN